MLTTFQIRTWLRQLSGIKHSKRISEWTKWNEVKELTPMWGGLDARLGKIVVGWQVDMTWKPSTKWSTLLNFKIIPNLWNSGLQTVKSPLIQDTLQPVAFHNGLFLCMATYQRQRLEAPNVFAIVWNVDVYSRIPDGNGEASRFKWLVHVTSSHRILDLEAKESSRMDSGTFTK